MRKDKAAAQANRVEDAFALLDAHNSAHGRP
jgi:hypothetical protein